MERLRNGHCGGWEAVGEVGNGVRYMQEAQLLEQLKELARQRGRVKAAQLLGVNFRTLAGSIESGKLSRRMREALEQLAETDEGLDDTAGDAEDEGEELAKRVEALEEEVRSLRHVVEEQAEGTRELAHRVEKFEAAQNEVKRTNSVEGPVVGSKANTPSGSGNRRKGPGVVTLEPQENETQALGPAAALVNEWRMLRNGEGVGNSRVERAKAEERRWELEIALIEEFGFTLPPETTPLNAEDRETHLAWRRRTLQRAWKETAKAERLRLLRRVLTLGTWRR